MSNTKETKSNLILASLLEKVNEGDSVAQDMLYHRYAQNLISLASKRISTIFNAKVEPEDIVQSVFRSFFVRHQADTVQFESWNELWSFLVCVTVRKCSEQTRKMLAEKRNVNRELALDDKTTGFGTSPEPTPQQVLIFEETLQALIEPLTDSQRDIVRMRLEGYTNSEISEKLGRTERTIYRSLTTLRERMNEMMNDENATSSDQD